jgi:hypothetical protein
MTETNPDDGDVPDPRPPSEILGTDVPDPPPEPDPAAGDGYESSRAQRGAAFLVAAGLVVLIAGTVVSLSAGGCLGPLKEPMYDYSCAGVITAPWFGVVSLVTVAAAVVGTILAVRDLTSGHRP